MREIFKIKEDKYGLLEKKNILKHTLNPLYLTIKKNLLYLYQVSFCSMENVNSII